MTIQINQHKVYLNGNQIGLIKSIARDGWYDYIISDNSGRRVYHTAGKDAEALHNELNLTYHDYLKQKADKNFIDYLANC